MKNKRKIICVCTIILSIIIVISIIEIAIGIVNLVKEYEFSALRLIVCPLLTAYGVWQIFALVIPLLKQINKNDRK